MAFVRQRKCALFSWRLRFWPEAAGVCAQYLDYNLGVFPSRSFLTAFIQASLLDNGVSGVHTRLAERPEGPRGSLARPAGPQL
jgi:hypothetical protein